MAAKEQFVNEKGEIEYRNVVSGEDVASAQSKARLQSAEGLGSKEKKGKRPMPKQSDYKDMGSFMKAMREYRTAEENDPDAKVVKRAMENLGKK